MKRVGIYCRVSSPKRHQLRSLAAQASGLTRLVDSRSFWTLKDIFIDVASGADTGREEYKRMLDAARQGLINLVVVKSSSKLGRDTVEMIQACRELAHFDCDVYFENADSFYSALGPLVVELTAAVDQAENESRSENIRWGIRRGLEDGSSQLYSRICYGYERGEDGNLVIKEDEAVVVRKIFLQYLAGASILKIKAALESEGIPAPRGGKTWAKKTIDSILSNQKYAGASLARTSCISPETDSGFIHEDTKGNKYVLMGIVDDHPPIIPPETFDRVQQMRMDRSNIEYDQDGKKRRKNTHYSSKRGQVQEESES